MSENIFLSLKEEPVDLLWSKEFKKLIKYSETNQKKLNSYWRNSNKDTVNLFLKYATTKLSFFEKSIESEEQLYSIFKIGVLLGAIESYANILYENQHDQLVANKVYEECRTVKYLDDIVGLLESHGGLTHSDLVELLSIKTSTLSEAIKKVLATGLVDVRSSGKYKIYSLTDIGIRYGRFIRNKKREIVSSDQVIMLLKHCLNNGACVDSLDDFKQRVIETLELDDMLIKKHQKVVLLIESPKITEIKNVEIERIENSVSDKTQIFCKWEKPKSENKKDNTIHSPIFLYYEPHKVKEKNYA